MHIRLSLFFALCVCLVASHADAAFPRWWEDRTFHQQQTGFVKPDFHGGVVRQLSRGELRIVSGIVTLNIVPTITRIQGEEAVEIPTDSIKTQTVNNPIIDLQEFSTTVRVREGNSIVLAGLISQIRQSNQKGLPLLRSIPGLRYFFEQVEDVMENKELVIYITPYIRKVE